MEPSSTDLDVLNKTVLEGLDDNFMRPMHQGRGLFAVLDLTEEQRTQIQEILKSQRDKAKSMRGSYENRPTFEERNAKRQEMRESVQKEIYAVLTTEQQAKLDDLTAQLKSGNIPGELIDLRIKHLDEKLNLTEEQKSQVKALITEQTPPELKTGIKGHRGFSRKRREQFKEYEEKMLNILTPEQQAIYQEMKTQRKDTGKELRQNLGNRRSRNRVERLTKALDLDETQKEQLKEIFANVRENIKGELNGRRNGRNRNELRQAMHGKMNQVDAKIQSILTEEQLAKYTELKSKRQLRRPKN